MSFSPASYLRFCLLGPLLVLGLVIPFNYVVDPYGIYHPGKPWAGIHNRPALYNNDYLNKAYAVKAAMADVLLLGSSRVALGLDPLDPPLNGHAYNLALMGSGVYENWRYLQQAASAHMPGTVVMGIDPEFFESNRTPCPLFTEDRLSVTADGYPNPSSRWADLASTLMSYSALRASYETLFAQSGPVLEDQKGYLGFHDRKKRLAIDVWLDISKEDRKSLNPYRTASGLSPQLDDFKKIASFCALHHIRFIVYLHPLHASTLDHFTADWRNYADWLRAIVDVVGYTPGLDGTLWDFTGYNEVSTEPFPPTIIGDSTMKYYLESSHYTKVVGDMVLERIFSDSGPANFGVRVTPADVDEDLLRVSREKEAWHNRGQCVQLGLHKS